MLRQESRKWPGDAEKRSHIGVDHYGNCSFCSADAWPRAAISRPPNLPASAAFIRIQKPHSFHYLEIGFTILAVSIAAFDLRMEAVVTGPKYECLLFDMDDTLYPLSTGINLACRKNIQSYMLHHLQIEESRIPEMCLDLYKEYGTTMAGLKALGHEFDNDEFHANVHGRLPYDNLRPDPVLRSLLLSISQRKIVFTNSDKAHAEQVLHRLGLQDCFEGIICFETLNPPGNSSPGCNGHCELDGFSPRSPILCKPSIEAMEAAIRIADVDPKKTILFDDSTRNIASAKAAGLHTVIVGRSAVVPGADHALESIHNIKEALPEIWDGCDRSDSDAVLPPTAVEAAVLA